MMSEQCSCRGLGSQAQPCQIRASVNTSMRASCRKQREPHDPRQGFAFLSRPHGWRMAEASYRSFSPQPISSSPLQELPVSYAPLSPISTSPPSFSNTTHPHHLPSFPPTKLPLAQSQGSQLGCWEESNSNKFTLLADIVFSDFSKTSQGLRFLSAPAVHSTGSPGKERRRD